MLQRINYNGTWYSLLAMPVIVTTVVTALLYAVFQFIDPSTVWAGMEIGNSGKNPRYCELNRMGELLRQPSNSWSNMCYFFFGMVCINLALADRKRTSPAPNIILAYPMLSVWYGLTLILLCWGSFFFHASLTRTGQHWDMTGTYACTSLALVINVVRMGFAGKERTSTAAWSIIILSLIVYSLFHAFKWHIDSGIVIPIVVLLVLITTFVYHRMAGSKVPGLLLALAFGSIIFAFIVRTMDVNKIMCDPESIFQGHALWHIMAGLAVLLIYFVLRAEPPLPEPPKS